MWPLIAVDGFVLFAGFICWLIDRDFQRALQSQLEGEREETS